MKKTNIAPQFAFLNKKTTFAFLFSVFLSACGGGSGGGSGGGGGTTSPVPTQPPTTPVDSAPTSVSIQAGSSVMVNQTVGLAAMLDGSSIGYDFQWSQTSGVPVTMISAKSQVLGFDVPQAGDYSFSVTARNASNNVVFQDDINVSASAESASATVRLDHAVSETAKVSLRADSNTDAGISAISWQQISGQTVPQGNFIQEDVPQGAISQSLFFDAPTVTEDQLLQFRATMTLENGENVSDDVYVLVKDVAQSSDGFFPGSADRIVTAEMFPYNANSPYAAALESCVYNNTVNRACNFSTLPLLGQVNSNPTINDVLDRLYVSHEWMGDRLKDYLENSVASEDMLSLFRGVTAVVISYEVRPSFYWVATGAIYLDAANFWVTPEERDTLNDIPDFRSAFGQDLQFFMPWRYVRNNQSYLSRANYAPAERNSRTFEDVEADITWLMYHELAHANDFFPPDRWSSIPSSSDPISYFNLMPPDSDAFESLFPLNSNELSALAQVSFAGQTASTTQRNYTDADATNFFEPDNAAMYYSFLTEREDYATLFERFMMAHRFGAEADTAVMKPFSENPELIVTWGQRSRINDIKLTARTRHVVQNILPSLDVDAIQPTLPNAKLMRPGESWGANLILEGERAGKGTEQQKQITELSEGMMPTYMLHHQHLNRPKMPGQSRSPED